jgi:hypothetical protein
VAKKFEIMMRIHATIERTVRKTPAIPLNRDISLKCPPDIEEE